MSTHGFKKYLSRGIKGVFCRICRFHVNNSSSTSKLKKSKGKIAIASFVKFVGLREAAFKHEFGTKSDDCGTFTPSKL